MKTFKTFSQFRAAYKATGNHFFDRKTMQFFNCRIESGLLNKDGKQFFITSEQYTKSDNRSFSLRRIDIIPNDIVIRTLGSFTTKAQAKAHLKS